jgi:hypothetical protein
MTSSTHNLPDESPPLADAAQHGDERSAYVGSARTVLVEQQLGEYPPSNSTQSLPDALILVRSDRETYSAINSTHRTAI